MSSIMEKKKKKLDLGQQGSHVFGGGRQAAEVGA